MARVRRGDVGLLATGALIARGESRDVPGPRESPQAPGGREHERAVAARPREVERPLHVDERSPPRELGRARRRHLAVRGGAAPGECKTGEESQEQTAATTHRRNKGTTYSQPGVRTRARPEAARPRP